MLLFWHIILVTNGKSEPIEQKLKVRSYINYELQNVYLPQTNLYDVKLQAK